MPLLLCIHPDKDTHKKHQNILNAATTIVLAIFDKFKKKNKLPNEGDTGSDGDVGGGSGGRGDTDNHDGGSGGRGDTDNHDGGSGGRGDTDNHFSLWGVDF